MSNEFEQITLVKITGRVQGVWFRDWTRRKARALGIVGWVRNRPDHSVEALFCGSVRDVEEMIEKCHSGSPLSRVDEVLITEAEFTDGDILQDFEIRETE